VTDAVGALVAARVESRHEQGGARGYGRAPSDLMVVVKVVQAAGAKVSVPAAGALESRTSI